MNRTLRSPALRAALAAAIVGAPSAALACGGFFCNNAEPVTQADEQILFAREGDQVEMHVQIRYAGPPVSFGWLLPVPPDVETAVSTDQLFDALSRFAPRFLLRTRFAPGCQEPPAPDYGSWADAAPAVDAGVQEEPSPPPGVNVLSREAVGPYDRAILQADGIQPLLDWLEQNDFQVPRGAEDRLADYLDGSVFVALKLLPGADTDDIRPLRLRFTAPAPAIPIRPTAVAAEPDMGVVVYVLGDGRAVPRNYLHVRVNEATITWEDGGRNYIDAVSHAVDEAGGQAFVTDYAGPAGDGWSFELDIDLDRLAEVRTLDELQAFRSVLQSSDVRPFVRDSITPPEGVDVDEVLGSPWAFDWSEIPCDGAWLAASLREAVVPVWRDLDALFARHRKLTRLFTTMSPAEMEVDPLFDLNRDLPDVANERWGEQLIECGDDDYPDYDSALITTADGTQYRLVGFDNPHAVRRAGGETVRGEGEIGAAVVERPFAAGMFEVITDNRDPIAERYGAGQPVPQPGVGGDGDNMGPDWGYEGGGGGNGDGNDVSSCACDAAEGSPMGLVWLGGLLLLGLRRRR